MKKLLITAAAVLATLNMYAQGTITFANGSGNRVYIDSVTGGSTAYAPSGSTYNVGLYWAPLGTTDEGLFALVGSGSGFAGTAGARTGIFSGGTRTVPAVPAGGSVLVQVRGWTTAYGVDYETGFARGDVGGANKVGKSNIFTVDTGDPTTTPAGVPGSIAGLQSFAITTVPEPSAIALGLVGAGALLLLRRRK